MNKCIGCGASLQDTDLNKEGYIKDITKNLCERCFRIKNYGDYKNISKENSEFTEILKQINNTNDLVMLVTDVFHLDIDYICNYINNPLLLVITKRDILPRSMNENRLLNYIENKNIVDKIIVSSFKNYNLDDLFSKIKQYKKSNNIYVVGYTNSGKSTLINKILYNYSDNKTEITTSLLPSTTLNTINIKVLDDLNIIDTPGLIKDNDLSSSTDLELLKKIIPKKEIKPITYQIKSKQYILIDNILKLEVENIDMTFYISNILKVERYYKDNIRLNKYELKEIKISKNEDLIIEGLGFIKFNKPTVIKYRIIDNVNVYTRKAVSVKSFGDF